MNKPGKNGEEREQDQVLKGFIQFLKNPGQKIYTFMKNNRTRINFQTAFWEHLLEDIDPTKIMFGNGIKCCGILINAFFCLMDYYQIYKARKRISTKVIVKKTFLTTIKTGVAIATSVLAIKFGMGAIIIGGIVSGLIILGEYFFGSKIPITDITRLDINIQLQKLMNIKTNFIQAPQLSAKLKVFGPPKIKSQVNIQMIFQKEPELSGTTNLFGSPKLKQKNFQILKGAPDLKVKELKVFGAPKLKQENFQMLKGAPALKVKELKVFGPPKIKSQVNIQMIFQKEPQLSGTINLSGCPKLKQKNLSLLKGAPDLKIKELKDV